jgi:L-amino acid N-acyltransferase YncA
MPMEIHEAGAPVRFEGFIELIRAEWPEEWGGATDEEMLAEMRRSHDPRKDVVRCMIDGRTVVGWYRWSPWPREAAASEDAHILDIAVLPARQGEGLGRALMEDLIEDCGRRGCRNLLSRTFESNVASIRLHAGVGFREAFRNGNSIVWELDLRGRA